MFAPKWPDQETGRTQLPSSLPAVRESFPRIGLRKHCMGFWQGRVLGDDKDVRVDYYWILDVKRGEALMIAQRSGKETVARFAAA